MKVIKFLLLAGIAVGLTGCGSESLTKTDELKLPIDWSYRGDLSEYGDYSAIILNTREVAVWDAEGNEQYTIEHNRMYSEAYELDIADHADLLAIANPMGYSLWELSTGKALALTGVEGRSAGSGISTIKLSDNGELVALGFTDGMVIVSNINTGRSSWYQVANSKVRLMAFDTSGEYLFTGSVDGVVSEVALRKGDVNRVTATTSRVTALAVDKSSQRVFMSNAKDDAKFVNIDSGEEVSALSFMETFRYFRRSQMIGNLLLTGTSKTLVSLWDPASGDEKYQFEIGGNNKKVRLQSATLDRSGPV